MLSRLAPRDRLILAVAFALADLILVASILIFSHQLATRETQVFLALAVFYGLLAAALVHSLLRHRA